jgi:hypothetical protein
LLTMSPKILIQNSSQQVGHLRRHRTARGTVLAVCYAMCVSPPSQHVQQRSNIAVTGSGFRDALHGFS